MKYVIDIDSTICIPGKTEKTRYTSATPISERINYVNKLYDNGHKIIYFTARGMGRYKNNKDLAYAEFYEYTFNQLNSWGCKFHELHLGKPNADYYIDDKGINANTFFADYPL